MKARILLLAALLSTSVVPAASPLELRPRAGIGFNPDGPVIGMQAMFGKNMLILAPSVDVAFVDGDIATAYNVDLLLGTFQISDTTVGMYVGGGLTFMSYRGATFDGNTLTVGGNVGEHLFTEARFGIDKMPDLRLLAGYRLRLP